MVAIQHPERNRETDRRAKTTKRQKDPGARQAYAAKSSKPGWKERRNATLRVKRSRGGIVLSEATRIRRSAAQRRRRSENPIPYKLDKLRRKHGWSAESEAYAAVLLADPCCYCGNPDVTIDHIVPLSEGGTHAPSNLTAACRPCNARKHARTLLGFLLIQPRACAAVELLL